MPGTDIIRGQDLNDTFRLAKSLALSKMFPDARTGEEALAKILIGQDLGLSPTQSLMGIHIVKGKPQLAATTLASFVKRSEDYDYRVLEHTDKVCSIEFGRGEAPLRDDEGEWIPWPGALGVSTFTTGDAETAGSFKNDSAWKTYPRNMVFARAMSNGVKWYCPDAIGCMPVYTEGEIVEDRVLDGGAAPVEDTSVALSDVARDIPESLRDRFYAAYGEAAQMRPGHVTPASVQMSVRGQSEEAIAGYLSRMEADNAKARQAAPEETITDAEVVPDDEDPMADAPPESPPTDATSADDVDVEALRAELNGLQDQWTVLSEADESGDRDAEIERVGERMDEIEALLRQAGAGMPGQESLLG